MADLAAAPLNAPRLLFELQQVNAIARSLSGCLDPEAIAHQITEALVHQFDCVFARIWLVEPDQTALRLVSSAGLYTHINGSFARVPMGAYKVGKIAQNRIPFLSNHLAEEAWVKDRNWAIANHIQGFAGYPLMVGDRVIGVLAAFSDRPLAPEFLEVLQVLCMTTSIALDAAIQRQQAPTKPRSTADLPVLSEQLATILSQTRPMLMGTEQPLTLSSTHVFLKAAEVLNRIGCNYCRLIYGEQTVALEAIAPAPKNAAPDHHTQQTWLRSHFDDLQLVVTCLGGSLRLQVGHPKPVVQVWLALPYPRCDRGPTVRVECEGVLLQTALTHLAHLAGLTVGDRTAPAALLLTDQPPADATLPVLWLRHHPGQPIPAHVQGVVDWAIEPDQLRDQVERILKGDGGMPPQLEEGQKLSDREEEVMRLLAQGLRDRDIAQHLYISESTVKFHINNSLAKLNARNRYQAVYQAAIRGWI